MNIYHCLLLAALVGCASVPTQPDRQRLVVPQTADAAAAAKQLASHIKTIRWSDVQDVFVRFSKADRHRFLESWSAACPRTTKCWMIEDNMKHQLGLPSLWVSPLPKAETVKQPNDEPPPHASVVAVFAVADMAGSFDPKTVEQLTDYLSTRMAESGQFRVVPQADLLEASRENKLSSYEACYDESCQIELGKAAAADKLLSTKILRFGSTCVLSAKLIDLREEVTLSAASVNSERCSDTMVASAVNDLVDRLTQ